MKKFLTFSVLFFFVFMCFSCKKNESDEHKHTFEYIQYESGHFKHYTCGCSSSEIVQAHNDDNNDKMCDVCGYNIINLNPGKISDDLVRNFKTAYANSISEYVESINMDQIRIADYFGQIGNAHIVSIKSSYYGKYPNGVYGNIVEKMQFRYDTGNKVYLIYNDKLFTAKEAYERNIIDFNGLCKVFGIHTSKLTTFNAQAYYTLDEYIKNQYKEEADLYTLAGYYGEYNSYYAVSYSYSGMQACVTFEERSNNLLFGYGYQSSRIRFINNSEMYSINQALSQNIITDEDVYDIFEIHTGSEEVSGNLIKELLTPAYELCLKYEADFNRKITFDSFSLKEYYGKYGESYIYSLDTTCWIISNTSATEEELDIMRYGFSEMAYVLNNGKLYTLDKAIELGIIESSVEDEIMAKYYGYF